MLKLQIFCSTVTFTLLYNRRFIVESSGCYAYINHAYKRKMAYTSFEFSFHTMKLPYGRFLVTSLLFHLISFSPQVAFFANPLNLQNLSEASELHQIKTF